MTRVDALQAAIAAVRAGLEPEYYHPSYAPDELTFTLHRPQRAGVEDLLSALEAQMPRWQEIETAAVLVMDAWHTYERDRHEKDTHVWVLPGEHILAERIAVLERALSGQERHEQHG